MTDAAELVTRLDWRRWLLPLLGGLVIALALWARSPAVPNIAWRGSPGVVEIARERAAADLMRAAAAMNARLEDAAATALLAPRETAAAFAALAELQGDDPEWGVILYDSAAPVAWSGRLRVPVDTLSAPTSVLWTPFYVALVVTRMSDSRRAVAAAVLHALPPADRLASGVVERVARDHPVAGFALTPPPGFGVPLLQGGDGTPLLFADPLALSAAEIRLVGAARWRARVVLAFGVALVAFVVVAARTGGAAERVITFGVVIGSLGLIPFNAFSRHSRLFDPSYYFTPIGGPWTSNGGIFLLSSVVLALGVIAFIRGRPRLRRPLPAVVIGVVLAVAGFIVVRELAAGIGQPARGATVPLWLSWQMPLFLVTLAFVLPIGWVVDTGIRHRRRLTRRSFLVASIAAAVVAASLVWLTTVGQRIRLAEADVAALNEGRDDYLDALLARFAQNLQTSPPPSSRVDLLREYAESDLAVAGYTFALGRWDAGGRYVEGLDLTFGIDDTTLAASVTARALASGTTEWERMPGPLGAIWVAAVPHPAGATSVVALPRSRLISASPHSALLGIPEPLPDEPVYSVIVAEGAPAATDGALRWWRIGRELHADAPLLTSSGPARAHLEIDLRSPEALGQRLVLIVLFNLAVAGLLLLLVRASEPGFGRRTRTRIRHWTGSFRSRIIVALFAFFVIPAAAFTVWGYSRLAAENRQLRRLVVRETLHAARVASEQESLSTIATRLRTPLFEYERGLLTATSDSLIDVLAPLGRALPPAVHMHLTSSGEVTANWEEKVGDAVVLIGYRTATATAAPVVLAAPARGSDEMMTRRARDIGVLLLFATAVGALGALWLSGIAAHQFSRPIAALRRAARAVARGDRRPPALPRAPSEFEPVFTAFRRMAADLERSRVELARAERVLAWGEMARQVAHEIKNPLTPIRLGVQYLQRARNDARVDFDRVFEENTARILSEIDRLDEIARAFSRYGSAPTELPPPEPVDVTAVLCDLVAFERMAADGVSWLLEGVDEQCVAIARREELREVLINVFENARAANARTVRIQLVDGSDKVSILVQDDGGGIAPEVLPRIFEPHFSTRTTGSGLGLAISRRLLDAWGGSIGIQSEPEGSTEVRITLKSAISG
ncbi:MAG TPA: HAMP domain-containing sensor histidine kinase [Gemmatimonadaceae bacterium]|nr:HAMP domain-containing sensor histidine kinase [Gemmatimonadaceae bacterium]